MSTESESMSERQTPKRERTSETDSFDYTQGERITWDDMTWIRSHAECLEVLRSPKFAATMHNRNSFPILGGTIVTLEGHAHTNRRRPLLGLVSSSMLAHYEFDIAAPQFAALMDERGVECDEGRISFDLIALVELPILNVVSAMIGLDEGGDKLKELSDTLSEGALAEFTTRPVEELMAEATAAKDEFEELFYKPARARREEMVRRFNAGELSEDDLPDDLITILLRQDIHVDDENLLKECIFFLTAAIGSSVNAVPKICYELLKHIQAHPDDRDLLKDDIGFLQKAVAEALRLHPPAPCVLRQALEDTRLSTGLEIPKYSHLAIDLIASGSDTSIFGDDASEFNPRREVGERVHYYGLSFGAGPHTCLAKPMIFGSGAGDVDVNGAAGFVVRFMHALLQRGVDFDPNDSPRRRSTTMMTEWEYFPVTVDGDG